MVAFIEKLEQELYLVQLVQKVRSVQLLQRDDLRLPGDPLEDELLVTGLAETEAVPVGLFPRQYPEIAMIKILAWISMNSNSPGNCTAWYGHYGT